MKATGKSLARGERGFSFILVLILMLVGTLIITAVLRYMGTGIKAAEVHEQKMGEFYAADSGLNDGLWQIKNDRLTDPNVLGASYSPYDFLTPNWTYPLGGFSDPVQVNGENVSVSISNEWMVKGFNAPLNAEAVIEGSGTTAPQLLVVGIVDAVSTTTQTGTFRIKLVYTGSTAANFTISTLGIWLPPGYTYAGTTNLAPPLPALPLYSSVSTTPWKSGQALVWTFSPIPFVNLPGSGGPANAERNITFQFNGPAAGKPPAISWVDTGGSLNIIGGTSFTWDGDKKVYGISATAGETTLVQRNLKTDLRQMAAAILGDYVAAGGTLMTVSSSHNPPIRNALLAESSATVNTVPNDASVAVAYLYWSGWIENQSSTIDLSDQSWSVSNPTGWVVSSGSNKNFDGTGRSGVESSRTVTLTNSQNLSSYTSGALTLSWDQSMASSSSGPYYKLFTFTPFAVPAGATIDDITVFVRSRSSASGTNDIRASIRVGGTRYNDPNPYDPSSASFNTDSYSWVQNPATNAPWTTADLNGTGTNPLLQIGVYSSDLNPTVYVSQVYAEVHYSLTRVPTTDTGGDSSGTWTYTPSSPNNLYSKVDETTPVDTDYIIGASSSGGSYYRLFDITSSNEFAVPTGDTVNGLTVYDRVRDDSSGFNSNDIRPSIRVNGSRYWGNSNNPDSSFTTESYTWATNPAGGSWTVDQINGVSSATELQQFGVYSSDLNPGVRVSMVYAEVNCTATRMPTGDGGDTFGNWTTAPLYSKVDETANPDTDYMTGGQSSAPALTEADKLYFDLTTTPNFSTYERFEALNGANPNSPFTFTVPASYRTSGFRMRFVYTFSESAKTVHVDSVHLNYQPVSVDNTAYLEINGTRVYMDGINPMVDPGGTQVLTSTNVQTLPSEPDSGTWYSAKVDVTKLVQAFSPVSPVLGATNHPGNATYTVGGVNATYNAGSEIAYAGWSLVIVYTSQDTLGHQLYLYDQFRDSNNSGNHLLSFPMGGFLVPEPIAGEQATGNAAELTAFVVEGDNYYTGDYLRFNGTKLWDGTTSTSNSGPPGSPNNVWNDRSVGLNADGVDVDNFYVKWSSNLLHTGDTSANIDIYTDIDVWQMVYIIISFRSEVTVGGSLTFLIE